jgi:hypothetical protein
MDKSLVFPPAMPGMRLKEESYWGDLALHQDSVAFVWIEPMKATKLSA